MHLTASQLREILLNEFTEAEVEALCEKLDVDYSRLAGTGLFGKTRELLALLQQQDRVSHLQAHMRAMRPHAFARQDVDDQSEEEPETAPNETDPRLTSPAEHRHPRGAGRLPSTADDPRDDAAEAYTTDETVVDDEEDVIEEPTTFRRRSASTRDVSRETNRDYEVVPQTRVLIPLLLVSAIIVFAALIVFLPSLLRGSGATSPEPSPTAPSAIPTPTSAIPVIDNSANAAAPTLPAINDPNATSGVVVLATPAPLDADGSMPQPQNAVPTVPILATPEATTPVAGAAHPAAELVQDANAALPAYYRGETGPETIALYWTGKAYEITVSWNAALPRVLKLGRGARNTIQIDYGFVRPPTVADAGDGAYVVSTREYWAYRNPAAGASACDTRDYTYTVRNTAGKMVIESVTSAVVEKTCR